jgi:ABC-type glycerol-3-phosphate transport system substrate-binding protein
MKNVRNLLAAAVLAAVAACSGDATAPEAAQHPSRPSLDKAAPDTTTAHPTSDPETAADDDGGTVILENGVVGPSGG